MCFPLFVVVKIDFRLLIVNRKPGGFLKLADSLDLVFYAVNSLVVLNTITQQSQASVIREIELSRERVSLNLKLVC